MDHYYPGSRRRPIECLFVCLSARVTKKLLLRLTWLFLHEKYYTHRSVAVYDHPHLDLIIKFFTIARLGKVLHHSKSWRQTCVTKMKCVMTSQWCHSERGSAVPHCLVCVAKNIIYVAYIFVASILMVASLRVWTVEQIIKCSSSQRGYYVHPPSSSFATENNISF